MSLLINDKLIWVSIPKNASNSIEHMLINSDLNITRSIKFNTLVKFYESQGIVKTPHPHIRMKKLINEFGNKETFCIKREFTSRFISSIEFIWAKIKKNNHTPIINLNEITNQFIYEFFNSYIINELYSLENRQIKWFEVYSKLVNEKLEFNTTPYATYESLCTLLSQEFWLDGLKCTYEFNTDNLNEFKLFIKNKFNVEINIYKINANPNKGKTNINNDEQFKIWLYNNFEKRFNKTNMSVI